VTLAQALNLRDDSRTLIRQSVDPVEQRRNSEVRAREGERTRITFRERAEQFLEAHQPFWSNTKHREQWRGTLTRYVYPAIGDLPAAKITTANVVELLRPLWVAKQETARRIRGRIEAILNYAADPDDIGYCNPASKTPQLFRALPRVKRKVENLPALPYNDLPAFFPDLSDRHGMAARALEFTILTVARTSETLGARWEEIKLSERLWIVPASRMKTRREHRVPLSDAAMSVLDRAREGRVGEFIFPSVHYDRPLSNVAMLSTLKRMSRPDVTTHGFRSTFRDWAGDCTVFDQQTIEFALAHRISDKTEAAYRRSTAIAKRRELMEAWGKFCTGSDGDVVSLESDAVSTDVC
jgi:integrase